MKTLHIIYSFIVLATATAFVTAQDYPDEYLGLPGDNLNLYAVMNLFQESETLEKFEQSLNSEDQMINNLDLNGDNLIDYITVSDYVDGNVHNIVLRAALNQKEQQDVAVFVVENMSNGAVQIQLIGDEALYGKNYIVEPIYAETPNPGYTGKTYRSSVNVVHTSYYDIAAWPVIRYIYRPGYIGWRSSWYWGYYPNYWRPWRAHYWHYYYGYHSHWHNHYYSHYRHWDRYRCNNYHTYYRNKVRVYSPTVYVNINNKRYRNTYSRPEQRGAGEKHYARTASSRSQVSARGNNTNASVQRSQTSRSREARAQSSATVTIVVKAVQSSAARPAEVVAFNAVSQSEARAPSSEAAAVAAKAARSSAASQAEAVKAARSSEAAVRNLLLQCKGAVAVNQAARLSAVSPAKAVVQSSAAVAAVAGRARTAEAAVPQEGDKFKA